MKSINLLIYLFSFFITTAQNYQIDFTGSGESNSVDSVYVKNLTQGNSIMLKGNSTLILTLSVGIENSGFNSDEILIYPNPNKGTSQIKFSTFNKEEFQILIHDITGKIIVKDKKILSIGQHTFEINGLHSGVYLVNIISNKYKNSKKLVSISQNNTEATLDYLGAEKNTLPAKKLKNSSTSIQMEYMDNERLLLKAFGGDHKRVKTVIPDKNLTIDFDFVECKDEDNNHYSTVKIGDQWWMAENLATTKYSDGTNIPNVTNDSTWPKVSTPAYCWYDNDASTFKDTYGALYNWYAVETGKLCPTGWHVPTDEEWKQMEMFIGMSQSQADVNGWRGTNEGAKLKATSGWYNNGNGTDEYGFSALPGGYRYDFDGFFYYEGLFGFWWSSTDSSTPTAWYRGMRSSYGNVLRYYYGKGYGFSVRCVRD